MQTEIIQPRIVIVEDSDKIGKAFLRRLNVVNKANGHCLIPEYALVSTFESFQQAMEQIPETVIVYDSVIVDINLGEDRTEEGLKVLEYIKKHYFGIIHPLVYTAYPNQKQKCMDRGVEPDSFLVKHEDSLLGDIEAIKRKIESKFSEAYRKGVLFKDIDLLVANSKVKRQYDYTETKLAYEVFNNLNKPAQLLLFHFFTNKIEPVLNVFSLKDRLWQFKATDRPTFDTTSSFFIQEINPETGGVEGIRMRLDAKTLYLSLPDFETIEKSHETIFNYVSKEDKIENRLAEFFLVKRLVDIYRTGTEKERQIIVELAKKIHYKENRAAFVFGIWEHIAKANEATSVGHEVFQAENIGLSFSDIFYCEIESIDETQEPHVASVRLQSVEDSEISFYRNFYTQTLEKYGLTHINERFKLIFYSGTEPLRESYTLIPVPPNVPF